MTRKEDRLSSVQLGVLGEMVEAALEKTVTTMERMLRIPLKVQYFNYNHGPLLPIQDFDALGRFKAHVVKVSFDSDIKGAIFFVINGQEIEQINKIVLPDEVNASNKANSRLMKKGFMSEIENLIASLSISEISESLGVELLGRVPEMRLMPGVDLNAYLQSQNELYDTAFHVKAVFGGRHSMNISPHFIWMLDQRFLETLKLNIVA